MKKSTLLTHEDAPITQADIDAGKLALRQRVAGRVVTNMDGKPEPALADAKLIERIRGMQARFDALCQRIEAGYASVPEVEGMAEIDAAMRKAERQSGSPWG